jgi:cytochrome P450
MPPNRIRVYQPADPNFSRDSHALYDRLRVEDPFHWAPVVGEWLLTRHADARVMLRHPDLVPLDGFGSHGLRLEKRADWPALSLFCQEALVLRSGPGHLLARRYFAAVLRQRPLVELAPECGAIVDRRLKAMLQAGGGDLVAEFTGAVPLEFIGSLLGIPADDMAFLGECAEGIFLILERKIDLDQLQEINFRIAQALDYLAGLLFGRRQKPLDDGVSRMLALADAERLDERVLAMRVFFLFVVGLDTMTGFLADSVESLLENPGELARWHRGEVDSKTAVEEMLRYTAPVALILRRAVRDTEVCGRVVAQGQTVTAVIEAVNRDPEVFTDPQRLRLDRAHCPHLAFGDGIHACLGAGIARMEGALALKGFVDLPSMRLKAPSAATPSVVLKAKDSLEFEFV